LRFIADMPTYPHHLRTFDYRGLHRYFLTFCTHERQKYFTDAANVVLVCDQVLRAADSEKFEGNVYCFMPDHLHLLVSGAQEDADLKMFVSRAKQFSAFEFSRQKGRRLWQRYGYERVLRNEESTEDVIRYIVGNPIRAGLVTKVTDYPFWGSFKYSREELLDHIHWAD
jgi:putative transposase